MSVTGEAAVTGEPLRVPVLARLLQLVPLLIAFVGMGISAYLSFAHSGEAPLVCSAGAGCDTVQESEYSELLGFPVALLGFVLYAAIFATGVVTLWSAGWPGRMAPFLVFGLALAGVLYSAYLTWLELYRIDAICTWCVASACLLTVLFAAATAEIFISGRLREGDEPPD